MALPIYTMQCFKLPKGTISAIETALANFWWKKGDKKGMHWIKWKRLSLPKREGGIGFRDIESFNRALLGKQVWRLLKNPKSLAFKLLQDRYFPDSTLMESHLGTKPSYLWRSLQEGKELLKSGLRCVVGDGTNIRIWTDPWLPEQPPRPPKQRQGNDRVVQVVSDVILGSHQWNKQLVEEVIAPEDVNAVLKLRISSANKNDLIGWHYTEDGEYTVKSGYWLATHLNQNNQPVVAGATELKRQIWKLKISPKLQYFLWRLLSKTVAVGSILQERHISTDIHCRRCCDVEETLDHLFFTCPYAEAVWRMSNIFTQQLRDPIPFEKKIETLISNMQMQDNDFLRQLPFWTLWRIWKSQNLLLYQRQDRTWMQTHIAIKKDVEEWLSANPPHNVQDLQFRDQGTIDRQWIRPPSTYVKCNYDCRFVNQSTPAVAGWIFRDSNGAFLEAGSKIGNPCASAIEAEVQALLMAMQQAWIKGFRRIIFEGDNQSIHKLLEGTKTSFHLHNWTQEIQRWRQKIVDVQFRWTRRECNEVADLIARRHNTTQLCLQFDLVPHYMSHNLF